MSFDLPLPSHGRPLFMARREMQSFIALQKSTHLSSFYNKIEQKIVDLRFLSQISLYFFENSYSFSNTTSHQKWFNLLKEQPLFFSEEQAQIWENEKPWMSDEWNLKKETQQFYQELLLGEKISDAYVGDDNYLFGEVESVWKKWLEKQDGLSLSVVLDFSAKCWEQWLAHQVRPLKKWHEQLLQMGNGLGLSIEESKTWLKLESFLGGKESSEHLYAFKDIVNWLFKDNFPKIISLLEMALEEKPQALNRFFSQQSPLCQFSFFLSEQSFKEKPPEWPKIFRVQHWNQVIEKAIFQEEFKWEEWVGVYDKNQLNLSFEALWGHLGINMEHITRSLEKKKSRILLITPQAKEEKIFLSQLQEQTNCTLINPIYSSESLNQNALWLTQWISQLMTQSAILIREQDLKWNEEKKQIWKAMDSYLENNWLISVSDISVLNQNEIDLFDQIIVLKLAPLAARLEVAQLCFKDHELALRVARTLRSVTAILDAKRWCDLADNESWETVENHQKPKIASPNDLISIFDIEEATLPPLASSPVFDTLMERLSIIYQNPEKFEKSGVAPSKGTLLIGPPGCGKTLFAKHLAHKLKIPCLKVNTVALFKTPSLTQSVFEQARAQAPCVLFLDEAARLICCSSPVVDGLLTEIDGISSLSGVLVVATTNPLPFNDPLHPALIRPGRLNEYRIIELPYEKERGEIWKSYLKDKKLKGDRTKIAQTLSQLSSSFSGADICEAVRRASFEGVIRGDEVLSLEHLIQACDEISWHYSSGQPILPETFKRTAIHEAGHALLTWYMGNDVSRITIQPRTQFLGAVMAFPIEGRGAISRREIHHKVMMCLGGVAAEKVMFDSYDAGGASDFSQVHYLLNLAIRNYGMGYLGPISGGDPDLFSENRRQKIEEESEKWSQEAYKNALEWLTENKNLLKDLSDELLKSKDMSGKKLEKWKDKVLKIPSSNFQPPSTLIFEEKEERSLVYPSKNSSSKHIVHNEDTKSS